MRLRSVLFATALASAPAAASAEVSASNERGFVSHHEVIVDVTPQRAWEAMLRPADWWNGEHTYSGDSGNLSLDASPGGCFCETIPASGGEIEHMRVIYAVPGSTLRMTGGLGPLQSEAVTGVLTVAIEPDGDGAKIAWDYVVGGYMRMPMAELAPLVDRVVGEQLLRLGTRLGTQVDPAPRRL